MGIFNADLVDDLARQKVVLFLGSGVSTSAITRSGSKMKGWRDFLVGLSTSVDANTSAQVKYYLDRYDYLLATEILKTSLIETWGKLVSDEYGQVADPSPLHEAIIGLDQRIILTTNFDKLIEICWQTRIGSSTHLPKIISMVDERVFAILKDHNSKFLVKIHGTVDDCDTLILSKSDYIRSAYGSPAYGSFLDSLFLNYTFLFIGFSMEDPAISALLEMYARRYPTARPHYMLSPSGISQNILDINKRLRKLQIIPYDAESDHSELPKLINELAEEVRVQRRGLVADALVN